MAEHLRHGGCHCGAVRYQVEVDLDQPATACNCSMCGRAGWNLVFVGAAKFKLEQGDANLTDYRFNSHVIHHVFCKTCGIKAFARGTNAKGEAVVAINVRTIDDIDVFAISTKRSDGRSR